MKKLLMFFSGLLLMALMLGALVLACAIYISGDRAYVETYFFQPGDKYEQRIDTPVTADEFGDEKMRQMLIAKYITELFYVTPDVQNMQSRKSDTSALSRLSSAAAFQTWLQQVVPDIEEMTKSNMFRTVSMLSATQPPDSTYWAVTYELHTWSRPNDMSVSPTRTTGIVYLDLIYKSGVRDMIGNRDLDAYLENGGDPAVAFKFRVRDIVFQE